MYTTQVVNNSVSSPFKFSFFNFLIKNAFVLFFISCSIIIATSYWEVISPEGGNRILLISTIFNIYAIGIVSIVFIFLGVFFAHTGALTQFIHRLGSVYLIYYMWLEGSGIIYRLTMISTKADLEIIQEDSLFFRLFFFYSVCTIAIFFFGVADRYFLSKIGQLEFPILVLFIHFGGLFAMRMHTFMDLLIALEIVTLASYVLVTFERTNRFSTYAGVQYFILGSLPSARLLLAFSLFYLQSGSRAFQDLDLFFNSVDSINYTSDNVSLKDFYIETPYIEMSSNISFAELIINYASVDSSFFSDQLESIVLSINPVNSRSVMALLILFFNFFFKITVAPFHVWAPTVYGKAPTASVAFLSIYSKRLIFFIRYKLRHGFLHVFSPILLVLFITLGLFSIFVGRVGAFSKKEIKGFFVYSSIGHVGFILIGLGLNTIEGSSAMMSYLAIYILTSFVMWFLLLIIGRSKTYLSHFAELQHTDPILANLFAFLIFSISGIPPLGGFFVKLDILSSVQDSGQFFTNYILFIFTVISFFYYLRVIKIIFFDNQEAPRAIISIKFSQVSRFEYSNNERRVWIMSSIILFLSLYLCFIQKPLRSIQALSLGRLFLMIY